MSDSCACLIASVILFSLDHYLGGAVLLFIAIVTIAADVDTD